MSGEDRSRREQIVARLYNEGWARADFDVVFELLDPGVVWTAIERAPDAGTYRGFESVRRYMQDWLDDFDFEGGGCSIEESIEAGDRLVCSQRVTATGKGSEVPSELRYACVYTFGDDERILEVNEYATREEALEGRVTLFGADPKRECRAPMGEVAGAGVLRFACSCSWFPPRWVSSSVLDARG